MGHIQRKIDDFHVHWFKLRLSGSFISLRGLRRCLSYISVIYVGNRGQLELRFFGLETNSGRVNWRSETRRQNWKLMIWFSFGVILKDAFQKGQFGPVSSETEGCNFSFCCSCCRLNKQLWSDLNQYFNATSTFEKEITIKYENLELMRSEPGLP